MIRYNPKDSFLSIFQFHKADTFRKLYPMILIIGLYSGFIAWLEISVWQLSETSHVKNLTIIHSTLGLVISLLLVFRTNTAYERWWEGRKIWGSLVNSSRNLALKIQAICPQEKKYYRTMIPNYAFALKNHLRSEINLDEIQDCEGFESIKIDVEKHIPNQIALNIVAHTVALNKSNVIGNEQLLFLNQELSNFTDGVGACERIRKTPIPFSYSVFLKKFIFLYVITLPFGYVFSLGYYVIPVVSIIFYVLASLELIAEEIEDPFGKDANDLPTDAISEGIKNSVNEILE
jgi:putative membrane protein